jgi:hypothetical protein
MSIASMFVSRNMNIATCNAIAIASPAPSGINYGPSSGPAPAEPPIDPDVGYLYPTPFLSLIDYESYQPIYIWMLLFFVFSLATELATNLRSANEIT